MLSWIGRFWSHGLCSIDGPTVAPVPPAPSLAAAPAPTDAASAPPKPVSATAPDQAHLSRSGAAAASPSPAPVKATSESLRFPFATGDQLALVSEVLGKGTAAVEAAGSEEFRIKVRIHSYSDFVKTAAGLAGTPLEPHMQIPLSFTRDLLGRYTLALGMGDKEMVRLEGLTPKKIGDDQALVDAQGKEVAYLRRIGAGKLTLEVPIPASLIPPGIPGFARILIPERIDLDLTKVGTAQDSPAVIQQKVQKIFGAAELRNRFTAGVAFGGEPLVSTSLGYQHTIKAYGTLARLQAGGKLLMSGVQNQIAGTIGGELSLAPWRKPFFFGANLGLYGGNFGPNRGANIGIGPELVAGYEHGPWQATISYTHVFGTTDYNLIGIGGAFRF